MTSPSLRAGLRGAAFRVHRPNNQELFTSSAHDLRIAVGTSPPTPQSPSQGSERGLVAKLLRDTGMEGLEALHHEAAGLPESHHPLELGLQLGQLLAVRRGLRIAGIAPPPIGIFRCRAKGIFKHADLPVPRGA